METTKHNGSSETSQLPSTRCPGRPSSLKIFYKDIDRPTFLKLVANKSLSVDTEADGLDWTKHKLRAVQLCTRKKNAVIVREPDQHSMWLKLLLSNEKSTKIFHWMCFDLRMIQRYMGLVIPGPLEDTKVLLKIARPGQSSGLHGMVKSMFGINLPKLDDYTWPKRLTQKHKDYMVGDVLYLHKALANLLKEVSGEDLEYYRIAKQLIRDRAYLEVAGYKNLLHHDNGQQEEIEKLRQIWQQVRG